MKKILFIAISVLLLVGGCNYSSDDITEEMQEERMPYPGWSINTREYTRNGVNYIDVNSKWASAGAFIDYYTTHKNYELVISSSFHVLKEIQVYDDDIGSLYVQVSVSKDGTTQYGYGTYFTDEYELERRIHAQVEKLMSGNNTELQINFHKQLIGER